MYGRQPASLVLAMESINCPLMPKSHSLMLPVLSSRILDGFTSTKTPESEHVSGAESRAEWSQSIHKRNGEGEMQNLLDHEGAHSPEPMKGNGAD